MLRKFLIRVGYNFCRDYELFHSWTRIGGEPVDYETYRWVYRCKRCEQTYYTYEPNGPGY
jgi:hypothetical protein